jgi:hypothetical protein
MLLRRVVPHHVDQVNTRLERAHHPPCLCVEHLVGNMIQQISLELKGDDEAAWVVSATGVKV